MKHRNGMDTKSMFKVQTARMMLKNLDLC